MSFLVTYRNFKLVQSEDVQVPENLSAQGLDGAAALNWTAVTNALSYDVAFSTNPNALSTVRNTSNNSLTISGLTNDVTYYFAVRANIQGKSSDYSATVTATPAAQVIVDDCDSSNLVSGEPDGTNFSAHPRTIPVATIATTRTNYTNNAFGSRDVIQNLNLPCFVAFRVLMANDASGESLGTAYNTTISQLDNYTGYDREINSVVIQACFFVDWAWDYLSTTQRQAIANRIYSICSSNSLHSTITSDTLVNHRNESPLTVHLLAYIIFRNFDDRFRTLQNFNTFYFQQWLPDNRQWIKSKLHHQGMAYIKLRGCFLLIQQAAFLSTFGNRLFSTCFEKMFKGLLLFKRASGYYLRMHDINVMSGKLELDSFCIATAGSIINDPELLNLYDTDSAAGRYSDTYGGTQFGGWLLNVYMLAFRNASTVTNSNYDSLPKQEYYPEPMGAAIRHATTNAVTGNENSDKALYFYEVSRMFVENHQCFRFGSSELCYKGYLYGQSGNYAGNIFNNSYWKRYAHRTAAMSDIVLCYKASEVFQITESGETLPSVDSGQRIPMNGGRANRFSDIDFMASEIAHKIDTSNEYSYLSGDITNSYSSTKISEYKQVKAVFSTGNSSNPLVVFSIHKVRALISDYPKSLVFHFGKEPTISGNRIVANAAESTADGSGRRDLTGTTGKVIIDLFGSAVTTTKKQGYYASHDGNSTNYYSSRPLHSSLDDMAWQTFSIPNQGNNNDLFVGAHAVGTQGDANPAAATYSASGINAYCYMVNRGISFATDFVNRTASFSITHSGGGVLVVHLVAGTWSDGTDSYTVNAGENCLYFNKSAATYTLTKTA